MKKDKMDSKKQKNFYTALYSSIGILLVVGAIASFYSLTSTKDKLKSEQKVEISTEPETEGVAKSRDPLTDFETPSSIAKGSTEISSLEVEEEDSLTEKEANTEASLEEVRKKEETEENETKEAEDKEEEKKDNETSSSDEGAVARIGDATSQITTYLVESEDASEHGLEDFKVYFDETSEVYETFNNFTDTAKMSWPIIGDIVMDFSTDHLVFDPTLEQYRTNDSISIKANIGDEIKASADGVVRFVGKTEEFGNTIVLDHGNGWLTTYSQLSENPLVNEGNVVEVGQSIAQVGKPTRYSSALGNHLDLRVSKNGSTVDPKTILAQ